MPKDPKLHSKLRIFLASMGPGIVTGAADDDPSGIGTYTVTGAQFGTLFLWTAVLTWPLMAIVQMASARVGMVTGEGLAAALRKKLPRWVLIGLCAGLFFANTLNVGADLSAMADAAEMLTGVSSHFFILIFGVGISYATVRMPYQKMAKVLKWLALSLFAYIAAAFVIHPDWGQVARESLTPHWPKTNTEWSILVAILGTTISPYLFFWQASQEVEEEKCEGKDTVKKRQGATDGELLMRKYDVGIGTFMSNLVMYFVILTAALTLHAHGITDIQSSKEAAAALKPIAGSFAVLLYTLGLLGVGFLAIPTLTGSAAYALAETFGWPQGLGQSLKTAKLFYCVVVVSAVMAVAFDFFGFNPIRALYWSAVINGLIAPFLLASLLWVVCDSKLMLNQGPSLRTKIILSLTTLLMTGAALGMFIF